MFVVRIELLVQYLNIEYDFKHKRVDFSGVCLNVSQDIIDHLSDHIDLLRYEIIKININQQHCELV